MLIFQPIQACNKCIYVAVNAVAKAKLPLLNISQDLKVGVQFSYDAVTLTKFITGCVARLVRNRSPNRQCAFSHINAGWAMLDKLQQVAKLSSFSSVPIAQNPKELDCGPPGQHPLPGGPFSSTHEPD